MTDFLKITESETKRIVNRKNEMYDWAGTRSFLQDFMGGMGTKEIRDGIMDPGEVLTSREIAERLLNFLDEYEIDQALRTLENMKQIGLEPDEQIVYEIFREEIE